jgi:cellulose synthase/poly-beta-1,6-N-acetylglucosamine synthase-like glycosyltransferase
MTVLLILFLGIATLLWLSVFGYLLLLASIASRRRHGERGEPTRPEIAVVIPTLNEEDLILPKLADLRRTDYPSDRMTIMVVDGGSVDRTTELVQQEIERGEKIKLLCLNRALGKADQINHALRLLTQEVVVVTDVDTLLEPSCIRELVGVLADDPRTGVVGATVRPASALAEERLHWRVLNYLWWLEGEAFAAANISGVCYACRRTSVLPLGGNALAEDIHLALAAGTRGYGVRLCRTALATEVRVPQSPGELLDYRRRRGGAYVSELLCSSPNGLTSVGWRLARLMRLWHFLVAPKVGVGLAVAACVLLWTPYWPWPLMTFAAFAAPPLAALCLPTTQTGTRDRRWSATRGAGRWLALTWISLLTLNPHPSVQGPIGGRT